MEAKRMRETYEAKMGKCRQDAVAAMGEAARAIHAGNWEAAQVHLDTARTVALAAREARTLFLLVASDEDRETVLFPSGRSA